MIQANIIHAIAAVSSIAIALGHIYMGTIGVEGAYRSMRNGYVDEQWAKEHHELWYNDVKSGKVKAGKATGTPGAAQAHLKEEEGMRGAIVAALAFALIGGPLWAKLPAPPPPTEGRRPPPRPRPRKRPRRRRSCSRSTRS